MRLMLIAVLVALYGCCIDSPKNGIAVEKGHSPRRFQNTIPVGGLNTLMSRGLPGQGPGQAKANWTMPYFRNNGGT